MPYILAHLQQVNSTAGNVMYGLLDLSQLATAGHSRGGKLAGLHLALTQGVATAYLIDPVDSTTYSPPSPDNPSAVAALNGLNKTAAITGSLSSLVRVRHMNLGLTHCMFYQAVAVNCVVPCWTLLPWPSLLTQQGYNSSLHLAVWPGAGVSGPCNPVDSNYELFWSVLGAGSWLEVVPAAGHMQFTNISSSIIAGGLDLLCHKGPTSHEVRRDMEQSLRLHMAVHHVLDSRRHQHVAIIL